MMVMMPMAMVMMFAVMVMASVGVGNNRRCQRKHRRGCRYHHALAGQSK